MTPISATEQMNRIYRYQRGVYDLTRRHYLLGRTQLISDLAPPRDGSVLEVGCGTASNLVAVAQAYPDTRIYGFDVSTVMLATARQSLNRAGLTERIQIATADATTFDGQAAFGLSRYDRIFASYMLSMVPQWQLVLEAMVRHLAPHGSIHIVDFGDCAQLPAWCKHALYRWLQAFHVSPRQDMELRLRHIADVNGYSLAFTPLFRGYAQHAVLRCVPNKH